MIYKKKWGGKRHWLLLTACSFFMLSFHGNACEVAPVECENLYQSLQGKWELVASRDDPSITEFSPPRKYFNYIKIYTENNFVVLAYWSGGNLVESFGGTFEVLSGNKIKETIRYYSPFKQRQRRRGYNHKSVVISGKSMSRAQMDLQVSIENDSLLLEGNLSQNLEKVDDVSLFGDMPIQQKFKRSSSLLKEPVR